MNTKRTEQLNFLGQQMINMIRADGRMTARDLVQRASDERIADRPALEMALASSMGRGQMSLDRDMMLQVDTGAT